MKLRSKILIGLTILVVSVLTTLVVFDMFSWYHIWDIPTKIVLIRLIISVVLMCILNTIIAFFLVKWISK